MEWRDSPHKPWESIDSYSDHQKREAKRKNKGKPLKSTEVRIEFWAELRLAARWAEYKWPEFRSLPANPCWMGSRDTENQAAILVLYRRDKQLKAMESPSWL